MKNHFVFTHLLYVLITFLPLASVAKPDDAVKPKKPATERIEWSKKKATEAKQHSAVDDGMRAKEQAKERAKKQSKERTEEQAKERAKEQAEERAGLAKEMPEEANETSEKKANSSDKSEAIMKEEDKGAEMGQKKREENRRKWWKFWP